MSVRPNGAVWVSIFTSCVHWGFAIQGNLEFQEKENRMTQEKKQTVIPKEQAVFWMDAHGVWHNEHGKLEHPKIIKYFNQSIQKDDQGYFLSQTINGGEEKVYFPYKETAVFAVGVSIGSDAIELTLNTQDVTRLAPEALYIKDDALFMQGQTHLIKFTPKALAQMTPVLKDTDQALCLELGGRQFDIPEK